jgi:hypothetical protein
MEQDEKLYEYRMGSEVFRFEAGSHEEAERFSPYALIHFAEKLGTLFAPEAMRGPDFVDFEAEFIAKAPPAEFVRFQDR